MFKSIRWTLQIWHAAILFLALASFGTVLFIAAQQTAYSEVDNELAAAARVFAGSGFQDLKPTPPQPGGLQLAMASNDQPSRVVSDAPPPAAEILGASQSDSSTARAVPAWLKQVPRDCLHRLGWDDSDQPYFSIWAPDGSIIRQSLHCPEIPPAIVATVANISNKSTSAPLQFRDRGALREVLMIGPANSTIVVGRSIQREMASLDSLRMSLIGAGGLIILVGLIGGSALSRRILHPIHLISNNARSISASDLSRRIDPQGAKSELASLVQTLNDTFARLEAAFHRQAQFTADASHELRTPLAVIHASSELALKRQRTEAEYRQTIESNLRASRRMQSLVESLLVLARTDSSALNLKVVPIDLWKIADDCVGLLTPVAFKRRIRIELHGQGVLIHADHDRILQLATNLISNAIQYNRDGGAVTVTVARQGDCAQLTVVDTGIGIPPCDQPRIFQRFYRAESARTREVGGSGLGLAICQSIARAHGGSISFTSEPMVGTTFIVSLPLNQNIPDA